MKTLDNTIVAFHVGRGGSFNNQGHLSFLGENEIGDFINDLYPDYENINVFKKRYGFADTADNQRCILDLITDGEFEQLEEKFGITEEMLGDVVYFDSGGNPVGLSQDDVDSGIGKIDIDGAYNTTYTKSLEDCDEYEIEAIRESNYWNKSELLELLGEKEEEEEEEEEEN